MKNQAVILRQEDLPATQQSIIEWCEKQIAQLTREHDEAMDNYEHAKAQKWRVAPFKRLAGRVMRRIIYYQKIVEAVQGGYLIVPNFGGWNIEYFAVRAGDKGPRASWEANTPKLLPAGEGRYVAPDKMVHFWTDENKRKHVTGAEYQDVEFPVAAVRPEIILATQRAMDSLLFDRLGVVRQAPKSDPMVIGEIFRDQANTWAGRRVTFFVAWWLDLEDI